MNIIKSFSSYILLPFLMLLVIFISGPRLNYAKVENTPLELSFTAASVEERISERNKSVSLKKDNGEQVIWFDGLKKTPYSIVYLHGLSASHMEGFPVHRNVARQIGANLFLSRLPGHGTTDSLALFDLTPERMVSYAKEAIAIGKSIGDKVIVMSCSTGSTLSAFLASGDPDIYAQIMFSPNFGVENDQTKLLLLPWGRKLGTLITGDGFHEWDAPEEAKPYWFHRYRIEGIAATISLIRQTITKENFMKIKSPVFIGYYYKNEVEKDEVVSIDNIKEMAGYLSTSPGNLEIKEYPDGGGHVFISEVFNQETSGIEEDVLQFLRDKAGIAAITPVALTDKRGK